MDSAYGYTLNLFVLQVATLRENYCIRFVHPQCCTFATEGLKGNLGNQYTR